MTQAYAEFWDNIKFTRGWAVPFVPLSEVTELLEAAAECVVWIRCHLDHFNHGMKFRLQTGAAHEYLWTLHSHPWEFPEQFVRDLVHATFKDGSGYVEGLTEEVIDRFLTHIKEARGSQCAELVQTADDLRAQIDEALTRVQQQWALYSHAGVGDNVTMKHVGMLHTLVFRLEGMSKTLDKLAARKTLELKRTTSSDVGSYCATESSNQNNQSNPMEITEERQEPDLIVSQSKDLSSDNTANNDNAGHNDNTAEEHDEQKEQEKQGLLKITKVAEHVATIAPDFNEFKETASKLTINDLLQSVGGSAQAGAQEVEKLRKRCLFLSEALLKDMMELDKAMGGDKVRAERKKTITMIQNLIDQADELKTKIKNIESDLKPVLQEEEKRARAAEVREKEEEEKRQKEEQTRLEAEKKAGEDREKTLHNATTKKQAWSHLRLTPRFEVQEGQKAYVVAAFIPGMSLEDYDIKLKQHQGQHIVSIEGVRVPSDKDVQDLESALQAKGYKPTLELLLKMGSGRYGRFSETYRLPADVDQDNIKAEYKNGAFTLTMPKRVAQPRHDRHPFGGIGGRGGGFFGDNDIFW